MSEHNKNHPNKGNTFKQLHHNGKLLLLPNVWDPLGAKLLENIGYPAIATASASIAFSNGYPDGEKIPFNDVVATLKTIVNAVAVPVTADIESGYANDNHTLSENIKRLLDTGIAGINIEDTQHDNHSLRTSESQSERIDVIRQTAAAMGIPLFINARTDVYLHARHFPGQKKPEETIRRGKAYKNAGADGFYPIFLQSKEDIELAIKEVDLPVNILLLPDIPNFKILQQLGVARLSLGPGFLKTAINAMKNTAEKLLQYEGMEEVKNNPVTSAYINNLINDNT